MIPIVNAQGLGTGAPPPLSFGNQIFSSIIAASIPLAGIVLFVMLVIGGFSYISSGGDPKKVAAAQATLTYAIGGIILLALAYLILRLIATFTGVNSILEFSIYHVPNP